MNLHILHDDKFTNGAIEQFEKFYPNQNEYIVLLYSSTKLIFTNPNEKITILHIRNKKNLQLISSIISNKKLSRVFVHFLDPYKASLTLKILKDFPLTFYWIFYGADLYDYLIRYKNYQIFDDKTLGRSSSIADFIKNLKYLFWFGWTTKRAMEKAFERLNYFCFWNEYDYSLFQSKTKNTAKFKDFIYYGALGSPETTGPKKKNLLMINHSASPSGNHSYIFDKLKEIDFLKAGYEVLVPLSYGNKEFASNLELEAKTKLNTHVIALRDFLPLDVYQNILSEVKIAVFGMRRQEAAGNVFQLLNMGSKVFLREENTLYHWLLKRNFIVFSLEKDFSELSGLQGLSDQQIQHNRKCYDDNFNNSKIQIMMHNLIDSES